MSRETATAQKARRFRDDGHPRGRHGAEVNLGIVRRGSVSSVAPRGMMNRMIQLPLPPACTTGAVIAIFSPPAGDAMTGAVIAIFGLPALPPKM